MIPKKIHYCWFGKNEKPNDVLLSIAKWRQILPDYEIKEWNESNFDYKRLRYTREAYYTKKYAFVSDVCRLEALYNEGGVYLGTDIEVLKTFNPFLCHQSFIGYEGGAIGTGVIGAEPHQDWIKAFLDSYKDEDFIQLNGYLNMKTNVFRVTNLIKSLNPENRPAIYPLEFFCATDWNSNTFFVTKNTVTIHHY